MKSPERWIDETPGVISDEEHRNDLIELYRRIQIDAYLDAYEAGMTVAAQIAESSLCANTVKYEYAMNVSTIPRNAILAARDALEAERDNILAAPFHAMPSSPPSTRK